MYFLFVLVGVEQIVLVGTELGEQF